MKPFCLEEHDGLRGIEVALADEAFLEVRHRALHVAEMDVEDPALGAEELDHLAHVRRAAGHLRAAAEAQVEAPGGAVGLSSQARLKPSGWEDARDAAEHGTGGSSGCSAILTPASSATGSTALMK